MAEITAALVKELRERTGVGMMDCKKALVEVGGELEKAIDLLRQKGLSKAAKKAGRATSEGLIGHKTNDDNTVVSIVEVKCETDFVARGDQFRQFASSVADKVFQHNPVDAEALGTLLGEELNQQIATLGENMSVGRFCHMTVKGHGVIGSYIHSNGKIGVLVEVNTTKAETAKDPKVAELARNIAMQVAATGAAALDESSLDPAIVERERQVFRQKTLDEGKPENIVDKIVDGRIKKFYQEVCLLNQPYIRDDKMSVRELAKSVAKEVGDELTVAGFVRLQLGEAETE